MKLNKDKMIYNILIFASILAIIPMSIVYSDSELFNCNNLIITGCNLSNKENIENQIEYIKNKSIFDVNKNQIVTKLVNNDFISSAYISTLLPNTIVISISEIIPISIIKINKSSYLVNESKNGFLYNENPSRGLNIPKIYFNNIENLKDVFEKFEYKFIQNIYSNYYSLYKKVNEIKYLENKLIVSFNINGNNNSVYFDSNDYKNQIQYLDTFLKITDNQDQRSYYKYIKFAGETIIVKEERTI